MRKVINIIVLIAVFLPALASATTIKRISFEEKVWHADRIVQCEVVDKKSRWNDDHTIIVTDITLKVTAAIKGPVPKKNLTITMAGGEILEEDQAIIVSGAPEFEIGDEKVLFLLNDKTLYCPVLGWKQGSYKVFTDSRTKEKRIKLKRGDKKSQRFQMQSLRADDQDKMNLNDFIDQIKAEKKSKKNDPKKK
jgi:hypothetical protein